MTKMTSLILAAAVASSVFTTSAMATTKKGQKFYLKKLQICKKDGFKTGEAFAAKHDRDTWATMKADGDLMNRWTELCPSANKVFSKMKKKDVNNLYDFCWQFASDGDVPTCD